MITSTNCLNEVIWKSALWRATKDILLCEVSVKKNAISNTVTIDYLFRKDTYLLQYSLCRKMGNVFIGY